MSNLETLLEDGLRSELMFQQQLKALRAFRQQLQETRRRHRENLEKRIHQNALLSKDTVFSDTSEPDALAKDGGMMKSSLTRDTGSSHRHRQSQRLGSSFPAGISSADQRHGSFKASTAAQHCERLDSPQTTLMRREEEDAAECQKKFCALPVPSHVTQPLYEQMMELKEKERKQGHEQRMEFLLSIQKPFSFQEREKEKREKLIAMLKQVSLDHQSNVSTVRKTHNEVKDLPRSKVKVTTMQHESTAESSSPKCRTAEQTRKEKLGFLYEGPSFQPQIIHQVPDFVRLHKELQMENLRKTQRKDVIKCRPFCLRTSALPARRRRMSPEKSQTPQLSNLTRSKSLGALTSLSTDTLPVYISDSVRKRCTAVRKSMEMRNNKNQETEDWSRMYQMRSRAMKKSVTLHARLLDPRSSLKEVQNEKLQQHRAADQQRMREYRRELRDIKSRVSERPYLFEQVTQKNAKAHAEQTYRNKLKKAGVEEQFVEEKGEAAEGTASSTSEDNTDEEDIHSRE